MTRGKVHVVTLFTFLFIANSIDAIENIGVNWGTQAAQGLDPAIVAQMLKDNGIKKIKLFDSDHWTVKHFAGTDIKVILGIPNNKLSIFKDYDKAKDWVKNNVSTHLYDGGVHISYVAVGNEPFLKSYNGSYDRTIFPALKNIQKALDEAGIGNKIKATIPQNGDVYHSDSNVPSKGHFRNDINDIMTDIVTFLKDHHAPFMVNIYPFLSLYQNPDFPVNFAFFDDGAKPVEDNNIQYTNMYDANLDTLVWSLRKAGAPNISIIVGEIGWPTDGHIFANATMARKFYDGLLKKMAAKKGTPLHPGALEVYIFSLLDENMKSIAPGFFERHWGIFRYDGQPKFPIDFSGKGAHDKMPVGAKNVIYLEHKWCVFDSNQSPSSSLVPPNLDYACSIADCTSLVYGGTCNNLDKKGNISYIFNIYFQMQSQDVEACVFQGLAKIVNKNVSTSECLFPIAIDSFGRRLSLGKTVIIFSALLISQTLLF